MNKNLRNLLALVLAMVLCMSVFAGCSNEQSVTDPTDAETTPVTETTLPAVETSWADLTNAERYPLESSKTYTIANRMATPEDREIYTLWDEVTGVDVNWVEMTGDVLTAAIAGGDMPDAICISWGMDKATAYEYGTAGKFVNFMDYLEYMPNFQAMLELYPHALDKFLNEDGTLYSLPSQAAVYGNPGNLLYVRMDMVEEAGLTLPTTVDEFKQFLLDIQAHYSDVEGFSALNLLMGGEWGYIEWNGLMDNYFFPAFGNEATQTGYDIVDGNVVLGCTTEQYKRYLEFIAEVYASGACEQDIFSTDCTNANKAKTAADQAAVFPASSVTVDNFESGRVELGILAPLTSEWQTEKIWTNSTVPSWMLNCINGELPEEDIITLVKWFDAFYATDEDPLNEEGTIIGACLWLGEEGVHYTVDREAGTYELLVTGDWSSTTEWRNNECCNTALYVSSFPYITTEETAYTRKQEGVRDNLWPYMVERSDVNVLFLNEDEGYDANAINTDLNLYMESAFAKFITGEWSVEANWDEYIKGLESLGAFDLVDIYQTAYDRQN